MKEAPPDEPTPRPKLPPHYLTDRAVAERYSIARNTVWVWAQKGRLPRPVKLSNGSTRWDAHELDRHDAERKP